jgi:MarR family transcriptional regulator for hemolysin
MALKKEYDKDNENHIGRKIILASKTIQHAFDLELRDKVGITLAQWRAINILTTENGITQREIAEKLGLDASSLIPLIDRLETKELVKRKSDKSDRRINRLYLTNRAESLVDSMHTCALSVRKTLTRNITVDQLEATHLILNRICQNLINHYGLDINDKPVERSINNLSSKDKITLPNPKK